METTVMKKGLLACLVATFLIGNPLSFHMPQYSIVQQTSITGKISPEAAAELVWAVNGKDTLKTMLMAGNFSLQVKPATYTLFVNAKAPYKNVSLGNLEVKLNQVLNVGEIILEK
jgi:hypothetical protein